MSRTEYFRKWNLNHPNRREDICKKYNKNHPNRPNGNLTRTSEINKARNYVQDHPEIKLNYCEVCPEEDIQTKNLTAHHPDYEYFFIIVTVCRKCHNWIDKGSKWNV